MIKVGDKLYQIEYHWGKKPDGSRYIFEVTDIRDHPFGGRALNCNGGEYGYIIFIPENTFVKVCDYRDKKLKRILK